MRWVIASIALAVGAACCAKPPEPPPLEVAAVRHVPVVAAVATPAPVAAAKPVAKSIVELPRPVVDTPVTRVPESPPPKETEKVIVVQAPAPPPEVRERVVIVRAPAPPPKIIVVEKRVPVAQARPAVAPRWAKADSIKRPCSRYTKPVCEAEKLCIWEKGRTEAGVVHRGGCRQRYGILR